MPRSRCSAGHASAHMAAGDRRDDRLRKTTNSSVEARVNPKAIPTANAARAPKPTADNNTSARKEKLGLSVATPDERAAPNTAAYDGPGSLPPQAMGTFHGLPQPSKDGRVIATHTIKSAAAEAARRGSGTAVAVARAVAKTNDPKTAPANNPNVVARQERSDKRPPPEANAIPKVAFPAQGVARPLAPQIPATANRQNTSNTARLLLSAARTLRSCSTKKGLLIIASTGPLRTDVISAPAVTAGDVLARSALP